MVPMTLTSSLFFWGKELERTSSLSRLGTVAPDRRLSSREQHGRLGMMCFFVSGERVLPSLPWMSASRRLSSEAQDSYGVKLSTEKTGSKLLRLSWLRSCTSSLPVGQFRVFCESVPRQILLLGFLVIPGPARGTRVLQVKVAQN